MNLQAGFLLPHPPLIIPEVGKGREEKIRNTINSYESIAKKIKKLSPESLIVISPHAPAYLDYFQVTKGEKVSGSFMEFGAGDVELEANIDMELSDSIIEEGKKVGLSLGYEGRQEPLDHGTMIPLYFIKKEYSCPIVRLAVSGFSLEDHYRYGMAIQKAIESLNRKIVVIVSGDLSHNLDRTKDTYSKSGEKFDELVANTFRRGEFLKLLSLDGEFLNEVGECGMKPLTILMGILDGYDVSGNWLSYEAPFGVGYGVGEFKVLEKNKDREYLKLMINSKKEKIKNIREKESDPVRLARHALESMVRLGEVEDPKWDVGESILKDKAGVFVSLNKDGSLRGCIGTLEPAQENVGEEIINNAVSAGLKDFRFSPVSEEELEEIVYSVDILGESEIVESLDDLDINRYGVIVESGNKRGVLLPNIASVKSVEDQVGIALDKANITSDEDYVLRRFEVIRYF